MSAKAKKTQNGPTDDDNIYVHQNRSGHITMDGTMNAFFKESMRAEMRLEARRKLGQLKFAPTRNPLKCEKTPRKNFKGFSFSVPKAPTEPSRWNYPEQDWGLLSKFPSQKVIYDDYFAKRKEYDEKVRMVKEVRAKVAEAQAKEREEMLSKSRDYDADEYLLQHQRQLDFEEARKQELLPLFKRDRHAMREAIDAMTCEYDADVAEPKPQKKSHPKTKNYSFEFNKVDKPRKFTSLYEQPISTFKSLGKSNPEVLEKWRAERAANFINELRGDPVHPPKHRLVSKSAFRPPGLLQPTSKTKLVTERLPSSVIERQKALQSLESHLDLTKFEIEKQIRKMKYQTE